MVSINPQNYLIVSLSSKERRTILEHTTMIEPSILEKISSSKGGLSLERYQLEMFLNSLECQSRNAKTPKAAKILQKLHDRLTAIYNIRPQIEKDFGDIPEYSNSGDVD